MSAIKGDYRTHKHIPSRSCYQLIIEVSEESFPEVCKVLGYPTTGGNTYVGIALVANRLATCTQDTNNTTSEGDKLRVRAVLLCGSGLFQEFCYKGCPIVGGGIVHSNGSNEYDAKEFIYSFCDIKSRSELAKNTTAQIKFRELLANFEAWKLKSQYEYNLNR